jgi:hypothetical protein
MPLTGCASTDNEQSDISAAMSQLIPSFLNNGKKRRRLPFTCLGFSLFWACSVLTVCGYLLLRNEWVARASLSGSAASGDPKQLDYLSAPVLVSYSYFEKDAIQVGAHVILDMRHCQAVVTWELLAEIEF